MAGNILMSVLTAQQYLTRSVPVLGVDYVVPGEAYRCPLLTRLLGNVDKKKKKTRKHAKKNLETPLVVFRSGPF